MQRLIAPRRLIKRPPQRHMEEPPPVPPKDTPKAAKMDVDQAPASGSKRKREAHDDTVYEYRNGSLEPVDADAHTPKRTRSSLRQSDGEHSTDTTPVNQRNLRRKKKVGNLSNLNLRHAAEQQRQAKEQQARESKFQEGSLTDKPSAQPPSAFTRMIRTDSGSIKQIDELMEGYNDAEPGASVELAVEQEKALLPQTVDQITAAQTAQREDAGGFFRFGRSFASNFHPVALWNKLWNETRDDLMRQNIEEAERKRMQKEEAEARYAEMKQAGQLGLKPVSHINTELHVSAEDLTPRDSAIVVESARTSRDHQRNISSTSQLLLPPHRDDISSHSGSEVPDTASKSKGTFRSRFTFKKPSVSNLKDGLKRVKSDFNLAAAAGANRESSSSVSPVKADFEHSGLTRSQSKFDLKKQHKLSKRVSNLETKLQQARRELDEALVEASPAPKLGNKYERFTPQSTLKRPRFVPGKLPSLPSERILTAEQLGFGDDEASPDKVMNEAQPRKALDLSQAMDIDEDDEGEGTIKARTNRQYPTRAASLFKHDNDNISDLPLNNADQSENETSELTQVTSTTNNDDSNDMDPNTITNFTSDGAPDLAVKPAADYASLDAKLKALDKNVKTAKKPATKGKKRKSTDDLEFKPGRTLADDDDAEWQEANANVTPRKKRKSSSKVNGSSPQQGKRAKAAAGKQGSPKRGAAVNGTNGKQATHGADNEEEEYGEAEEDDGTKSGAVPDDLEAPVRRSMDSQGQPLEPLYEEEEETTTTTTTTVHIPLKDVPSRPTAMATPARYVPRASRSRSPAKRGAEETMFTRAAEAAQGRRPGRSNSPPPSVNGNGGAYELVGDAVMVKPGEGDVPRLPNGHGQIQNGAEFETMLEEEVDLKTNAEKEKEAYEWPEDVF